MPYYSNADAQIALGGGGLPDWTKITELTYAKGERETGVNFDMTASGLSDLELWIGFQQLTADTGTGSATVILEYRLVQIID